MAEKQILIIAGESSSDLYAKHLIRELKKNIPQIKFFGLGGPRMLKEEKDIQDITHLASVGFWEVLKNFRKFKNIFNQTVKEVENKKPLAAILVDYPGFNLKLAQVLKKKRIPVIYYISPQIWAWAKGRIKKIKKYVDLMLVFFKFEEELYRKEGINATFVGHPLLEIVKPALGKEDFLKKFNLPATNYTISLLAGSRRAEVKMHLSLMLKTASYIYKKIKDVKFLILKPAELSETYYENIKSYPLPIYLISNNTYNGLSISDFAMVCAGTATLETAILGVPMVIIYKTSLFNWLIIRPLIKIPYIGMVNIVADRKIVPEFIQYKIKPFSIASYIIEMFNRQEELNQQREELLKIKSQLGTPGAIPKSAEIISSFLKEKKII